MQAEIGLIGLGVMGANLALNIAEKGFPIAVYNRTWATTEKFIAEAGVLAPNRSLPAAPWQNWRPPSVRHDPSSSWSRPASRWTNRSTALREVLASGDIIIDAGNANYHDTVRRDAALSTTGPDIYRHGRFRR